MRRTAPAARDRLFGARRYPGRRTRGGEQRLSDFMLWEAAYAELVFTERMWPDFGGADLASAVAEFSSRNRRYGSLPEQAAG